MRKQLDLLLMALGGGLLWLWQRSQQRVKRQQEELQAAQASVQRARAQVEAAEELQSNFLANMSHELRTPLNAIINFSEFTLSGDFGPLTEQQEMFQQRIRSNGRHLLGLINDILDLATIEAGQVELEREPLDLLPLLEGVRSTAVGMTREKAVEVLLEVPGGLPAVWADPPRVRRILLDLLSNAAKFTAQGRITLRAQAQNGHVAVSVSDTGIGIAPDLQRQIFEPFYQAQRDLNREYGGTGLGLPICKQLVEMHGGTLTVQSVPGAGSTFTFTLPRAAPDPAARASQTQPEAREASITPSAARRVVVIDDDPDTQAIFRHTLEGEGWQVHAVFDSREAEARVREVQPHLILLDLQMPVVDGWTLLERFHRDPTLEKIPVLICSINDPSQPHIGVLQQVRSWLVKPVVRERLLAEVARYASVPGKVLVVDDDADSRTILRAMLVEYGWEVQEAQDGEQALALLANGNPDVMILDLMMPRVDGFEVLRRLENQSERLSFPVVVLTAQNLTVEEQRWLAQRTQGYFQKMSFPLTDFALFLQSLVERDTGFPHEH